MSGWNKFFFFFLCLIPIERTSNSLAAIVDTKYVECTNSKKLHQTQNSFRFIVLFERVVRIEKGGKEEVCIHLEYLPSPSPLNTTLKNSNIDNANATNATVHDDDDDDDDDYCVLLLLPRYYCYSSLLG